MKFKASCILAKPETGARETNTSLSSEDSIDPQHEKRLLHKLDWHILPILFILYLCAFLDRVNIGNARIQGLETDLHMRGNDYNIALLVFFVPYILLEVPSNMILKKLPPSIYLPGLMVIWGIVTICQGVTQSFAGLVVCRVLLGVFEAGVFPGMAYLVSMFYKRTEYQLRLSLLYSASLLAGAISGLLAYGIGQMDGICGYAGWRWIFILEGIATVLIAIIAFFFVSDWPESAKFLDDTDRQLLYKRLSMDKLEQCRMDRWNKQAAKQTFGDIKIWLGGIMLLGAMTTAYAFSFFAPTILKQLGWSSLHSQIMSIPIWIAGCVASVSSAYMSDKLRHRYAFLMAGVVVTTVGYALLLAMHHVSVAMRYFALYLVVAGCCATQPMTVGWLNNNLSGHYKRGIGAAVQIGIGNVGGLIGSTVFLSREAPTYHTGYGVSLGLVWVCAIAATAFLLYLQKENSLRDEGGRDYRYKLPDDERDNLGDDHPAFRFIS